MYIGTLAPRSNRAGWSYVVEIKDDDTDEAVDISDCTVVLEIAREECGRAVLSATTDNGKVTLLSDVGFFQVDFTADEMKQLCSGTYHLGCTLSNGDSEAQQLIIGALPILDGVVSR